MLITNNMAKTDNNFYEILNECILSFADLENEDSITIEFKAPYNEWRDSNENKRRF